MNIGVDIDGVIANTLPLLVKELNNFFGEEFKSEEIYNYDIGKVYNKNQKELASFIKTREDILATEPEPVPGAIEYVNKLKANSRLFIISARTEKLQHQTEEWLLRYGFQWDELILLGSHEKAETCHKLKINYFIEDSLYNAQQISSIGVHVFLMDAPYNQGRLPRLVCRCHTWQEVYNLISNRSSHQAVGT